MPLFPPNPLAQWQVPVERFAAARAYGCTTLVGIPTPAEDHDPAAWMYAARDAGFSYIVHDRGIRNGAAYTNPWKPSDPNLLAVGLVDEPDGAGNLTPDQVANHAADIRLRGWGGPLYLNFDGGKMDGKPADAYAPYVAAATTHGCPPPILGFDLYLCNRGLPDVYGRTFDTLLGVVGQRIKQLKTLSPGSDVLACIETGDFWYRFQSWAYGTPLANGMRGPTADELKQQLENVVSYGGIPLLFTVREGAFVNQPAGAFSWDVTPRENADVIVAKYGPTATRALPAAPAIRDVNLIVSAPGYDEQRIAVTLRQTTRPPTR